MTDEDSQLDLLRHLAVSWRQQGFGDAKGSENAGSENPAAFGGPTVEPAAPWATCRLYDGLAQIWGLPHLDPDEEPDPDVQQRIDDALSSLSTAFPTFLEEAKLSPGTYTVVDRSAFLHVTRRLSWKTVDIRAAVDDSAESGFLRFLKSFKGLWGQGRAMLEAEERGPQEAEVEVTPQDLQLLRHLKWRPPGDPAASVKGVEDSGSREEKKLQGWIAQERLYPVPMVDTDNPYGALAGDLTDMEVHFQRMAEILGESSSALSAPLTHDRRRELWHLHHRTQGTLQVFLQHAIWE